MSSSQPDEIMMADEDVDVHVDVDVDEEQIIIMSIEEYKELLVQVSNLSLEDAGFELLEAARYGDVPVVRALLETFPLLVNNSPDSGSTALHKASANGHLSTVQLLILGGATHSKNTSSNTPLHWAASNGHFAIVELLLSVYKDIDVLDRNDFGRSALTEGFGSQSTETAKLLLEHDSASEERLILGPGQEPGTDKKKESVIHDFIFAATNQEEEEGTAPLVKIRELPITDDPFGNAPIEDTAGFGIWCASLVMARWMASIASSFEGKTVVELGAGCGVPGLALAKHTTLSHLIVTDLNPQTVTNLQFNVELNDITNGTTATTIDWDDESTWPAAVDTIIGSDLIYSKSIVPLLKKVVLGLVRDGGSFYYVAPDTGRDGLDQFLEEIQSQGFNLKSKTVAPPAYHENPLASKDEEEAYVHFTDLASSTYYLYEFTRTK